MVTGRTGGDCQEHLSLRAIDAGCRQRRSRICSGPIDACGQERRCARAPTELQDQSRARFTASPREGVRVMKIRKERLAELFGLLPDEVPEDGDIAVCNMFGRKRPSVMAW